MSDSDSDHESLDCGRLRNQTRLLYGDDCPVLTVHPEEATYKKWHNIPLELKREVTQSLKVCSFWLPLVLQRQRLNISTRWAMHVGFIDSVDSDLDLKHLYRIEVLESILRAVEGGCVNVDQAKHFIWISNKLNLHVPEVLDDALQWLQHMGDPDICKKVLELGPKEILFITIQYIFAEYSHFLQSMGVNTQAMVKALMTIHVVGDVQKSEEMKTKGNNHFQKREFDAAIKCYTDAIRCSPENHVIYGNRALCYIRCEKYLKAAGDGKRAILLEPMWAKGHYRYCEALFYLKEHKRALASNTYAQGVCTQTDFWKELCLQQERFFVEMMEKVPLVPPQETKNKGMANPNPTLVTVKVKVSTKPVPGKVPPVQVKKTNPGVKEGPQPAVSNTKHPKQEKSETDKSKKEGLKAGATNKSKKDKSVPWSTRVPGSICTVALRGAVHDGSGALADLRFTLAEKAFSQALSMLQSTTPKDLGITTLDEALLHYGHASALIGIGQPQELGEALREFGIIKSFEKRTFECLVYYGIGRVYFKENRFKDALARFMDSMQMVNKQITPGKLTWPLTKEIVKETQLDYFKGLLLEMMESCTFPPMPDAFCRHGNCIGHIKTAIYFTDPDFKGFIRIVCCQGCVVEYHISCWKSIKTMSFSDKEKDFLQRDCFTPDCNGAISNIQIYSSTGVIKCKLETVITKPEGPKKSRVNQKCTSLKKLESKKAWKLRRKQNKQASKAASGTEGHPCPEDQVVATARPDKHSKQQGPGTLPLHRDRVLFQIRRNRGALQDHPCPELGALVARLRPWVELDSSRGDGAAASGFLEGLQVETLGQLVDLLLERGNRVWARIFIEVLGSSLTWAQQLDNQGLNAASVFIETYGRHLEEMDPSFLLHFLPMQDMLVARPELLRQSGAALMDYLRCAPPQDMRLFIWTLEEHRHHYDHCHTILDEYFEILDGDCQVMKKSDNVDDNNSPSKTRNRGRKKKPKDQKAVIIPSGMRGATQRDSPDFFGDDEDTLSLLERSDPFSVPERLRDQVAYFESRYNPTNHKSILDNNPDPTEVGLYDYFHQILEEHGPLSTLDPLLVGQLGDFPAEAQQKIVAFGGLEAFLLQSPRFIHMGEHNVYLRQAGHVLDHLDELAQPHCDTYQHLFPLPSPYGPGSNTAGMNVHAEEYWPYSDGGAAAAAGHPATASPSSESDLGDLDQYGSVGEGYVQADGDPSVKGMELGSAEACHGGRRGVAVETDDEWGLRTAVQTQADLEKRMRRLVKDSEGKALQHERSVAALEREVEETTTNIQVTNKEVELFQQKLEEMVRKDQKEKKANQEELKGLKLETAELVGKNAGLSKSLQEKCKQSDKQLSDFCDLSNGSAVEKMSLEDEIKRCHGLYAEAVARSQRAALSVLENTHRQNLYCLHKSLSDSREILLKIDQVASRHPPQVIAVFQHRWRSCVQEATDKISMVERRYQEQVEQVEHGVRLSALSPVSVPSAPEPPIALMFSSIQKLSFGEVTQDCFVELPAFRDPAPSRHRTNALGQAAEAPPQAPLQPLPAPSQKTGPQESQQLKKFNRILEQLATIFPGYSRQELMKFVHTWRRVNGGVLPPGPFQDSLNAISQIILDDQAQPYPSGSSRARQQNGTSSARVAPPPATHAWLQLRPQKHCTPSALNIEDPCIICHEEMPPESMCVLQCRHSFHKTCITSWLKEQQTCPTCRKHTLLPDDFPALAGRLQPGHPPQ